MIHCRPDVILCVEASLDAASQKIKLSFLDSASQATFSAHLQAVAAEEAEDKDDDNDARPQIKLEVPVDEIDSRSGFVKHLGLKLEPCSAIETEYVAIERAVLESFYFCWQDHSREVAPFTQSPHSASTLVLANECA